MPSFEGQTIQERYRLEKMIGEGATATIWSARHVQLDRQVAVKFIHAEGRDAGAVAERFLREARIAAAIRHRMVVDILDFGTAENGQPFMVMEYLIGIPLDRRLAQEPKLRDAEILRIADLALCGLAAIHDAGIVHRDIKPANIFLVEDADGYFPKLLDFGISKAVGPAHLQSALTTKSGWLFGTPRYMAPEQARGMMDIDRRADIYSFAVVLYEALAGRLPYNAEHMGDLLMSITAGGAAPVLSHRPELGPMLSAVVERAMALKRENRYDDARAMRNDLRAALASLTPSRRPESLGLAPQLPEPGDEPHSIERAASTPTMALGETTPAVASLPSPTPTETHVHTQTAHSRLERRHLLVAGATAAVGIIIALVWSLSDSENAPAGNRNGSHAQSSGSSSTEAHASSTSGPSAHATAQAEQLDATPVVASADGGIDSGGVPAPDGDAGQGAADARKSQGPGRKRRQPKLLRDPGF